MARFLREMTEQDRRRGLAYIETTVEELLAIESPTEDVYKLLAEAVITKARLTSIKGVKND